VVFAVGRDAGAGDVGGRGRARDADPAGRRAGARRVRSARSPRAVRFVVAGQGRGEVPRWGHVRRLHSASRRSNHPGWRRGGRTRTGRPRRRRAGTSRRPLSAAVVRHPRAGRSGEVCRAATARARLPRSTGRDGRRDAPRRSEGRGDGGGGGATGAGPRAGRHAVRREGRTVRSRTGGAGRAVNRGPRGIAPVPAARSSTNT
jgi:hypothetical protein